LKLSKKDRTNAEQYLKSEELVQFLQYGNTQKYTEKFESVHGNVLRNNNLKDILHYAIIQAIINNFNESDQITLIIPSSTLNFF